MRIVLPEERRSGVKGNIHSWQLRGKFVFQLLLPVGAVQMLEISSRVITCAKIELQVGAVHLHFQPPESSILQWIIAREP